MGDFADLKQQVGEIHADVRWIKQNMPTFDKRLRKQERRSAWMMGVGIALAAVCAKVGLPDLTAAFFH